MAQRNADVQRLAAGAHAVGQQVWSDGNRLNQYVSAARPSDVAALGVRAMQKATATGDRVAAGASDAVARQIAAMSPAARRIASGAGDASLAGLNGAQDAFTFGLGDRAYAGVRALADAADGADLGRAYSRHYAGTQALDAYDEGHHPIARGVGEVAGTAAQIGLLGAGEGGVAALKGLAQARRIPQASRLLAREGAALAGGGATAGFGGQAVGDFATGRHSSPADYAAATLGGVAGVGATILSRGRASAGGAADGAVTSVAQDLLNGRPVSMDNARQAAVLGATVGSLAGGAGRAWSNSLSRSAKGQLGEGLSKVRTVARGDMPLADGSVRLPLVGGGFTIPDHLTEGGEIAEAKFGNYARLSPRQRQAYQQPLPNYRVDHFLPRDIGAMFGAPANSAALGLYRPTENFSPLR